MLFKTVLTSFLIGAISVNALAIPVPRSPVPEPECESPRLFSTISYRDLTFVQTNSSTTRGPLWECERKGEERLRQGEGGREGCFHPATC